MIRKTLVTLALGLSLGCQWSASGQDVPKMAGPAPQDPPKAPRVEVVFVLDTTGSMGGLIEGAKQKIWSIATQIERGKPRPELYVGLVEYRDRGDQYVTRVTPLTENLDKIHGQLSEIKAAGGGDTPEDVLSGLSDALTKIQWSKDKTTLKIIFLVGDAPPHQDYLDVETLEGLCQHAAKAEVIINTIRCGGDEETGTIWQQIARKSEGQFASIDQRGGVVAVATPYDKDLSKLSDDMGKTLLAYGAGKDDAKSGEAAAARLAAPAEKADRAACKAESGRMSSSDLVDAVKEKRVKLEEVKDEQLPEEMQKMTTEEKQAHLEKKGKERDEIRTKVLELSKQREAYIAEELKKRGVVDSFDAVVKKMLAEQGKKKGIEYKD